MMHCEEAISLMPACLEADLGSKALTFQEHIRICSSCRRKLKELEESRLLLSHQRDQAYNAPRGLVQDVLVRLERERAIRRNRYFALQVVGWSVLILSAIYIVFCHVLVAIGDRNRHHPSSNSEGDNHGTVRDFADIDLADQGKNVRKGRHRGIAAFR